MAEMYVRDHSENIPGEWSPFLGGGGTEMFPFIGGWHPDFTNLLREMDILRLILIIHRTKIAQMKPKNT